MELFAYEYAEATLDKFARRVRSEQFRRAYRKFKFVLVVYAYLDFSAPEKPEKKHLAWAWEDAQAAFNGHGETILHGCILQMWSSLTKGDQDQFLTVAGKAFYMAETETHREAPRRYIPKVRKAGIRDPRDGFSLPTYTPIVGVKLQDWLHDEGFTQEEMDRFTEYLRGEMELTTSQAASHLRVVEATNGSEG